MVLPACEQASESNRPPAPSDECRVRWDEQGLRHRMLRGTWEQDAEDRLKADFHESTWQFLPRIVLSFNPSKTYTQQTATLYDSGVTVHGAGEDLAPLGLDLLWPQQQETLEFVRSMNDAFVLRSWDAKRGRVRYLSVAPDCIDADPDPDDPSQPCRVAHYRKRRVSGYGWVWCRDTYDFSQRDPDGRVVPWFQIDAWVRPQNDSGGYGEGDWVDVTYLVLPDLDPAREGATPRRGRWMYWTSDAEDAEPIWCWTAYHQRIGSRLFDPWANHELVDLTLVAAVLWTYWLGGFRDASHLQRFMLDCDIAGTKPTTGGDNYVHANPFTVLKLKSTAPTGGGQASAFPSAFDPEKAGLSIANLVASGALFAGLSPADVSIGSAGLSRTSGFAIEVSRDGKRKVELRLVAPMQLSDRHNLAGAAALANAYAEPATDYPTDPEAYGLVYSSTPRTTEEIRAEVDEVTRLTEAGLMHPGDAIRRLNPHLTDDAAKAKALEIAQFKADLAAVGATNREPDLTAAVDAVIAALPTLEQMGGAPVPEGIREALDRLRGNREPVEPEDEAAPAA